MPGENPSRHQSTADLGVWPGFAADVELLPFDDEAFVYSATMQALFSLNATALFIWRAFEAVPAVDEAIARTAAEFAMEPDDARIFVEAAIGDWHANGLLEGSPRDPGEPAGKRSKSSGLPV
jgi:hypothetical protein